MNKKRLVIIISLCIIILPILFYNAFSFNASHQFKESTPPDNRAKNIKDLTISLLQNNEFFVGDISVRYMGRDSNGIQNKALITVLNTSTGDDSIGATEYKMIAEKKGEIWILTDSKTHWKCARSLFFNFWTTKACI